MPHGASGVGGARGLATCTQLRASSGWTNKITEVINSKIMSRKFPVHFSRLGLFHLFQCLPGRTATKDGGTDGTRKVDEERGSKAHRKRVNCKGVGHDTVVNFAFPVGERGHAGGGVTHSSGGGRGEEGGRGQAGPAVC